MFYYCGDIASAVECDKRGACQETPVYGHKPESHSSSRERKRKLDWHCVYVFVRMVQGYAIALLGTNVTHPVFMKYHPIGTHIQTYSPPRLQQQDTSLRAWSIVLELVCVCHAASLDVAAVSPPFSSPPGWFQTRTRKKDINSCVQWQNKHIYHKWYDKYTCC